MALEIVQPGGMPLGQFDGADGIYLTVKGGEVATIKGVTKTSDSQAYTDGYVGLTRPVATTSLIPGDRPLMLVDDGIYGYGTMFGSVIGGIAGQISYGVNSSSATQLGPHTAAGSGKLTLWDKAGTYAITLDAVDTATQTGLQPTNSTLKIGSALYAKNNGVITPNSSLNFDSDGYATIGRFLNFESYKGGSLVTTPVTLVTAALSPTGTPLAPNGGAFRALIYFAPTMV
jgi:hypothetical protein